jgi:hypothetical protein
MKINIEFNHLLTVKRMTKSEKWYLDQGAWLWHKCSMVYVYVKDSWPLTPITLTSGVKRSINLIWHDARCLNLWNITIDHHFGSWTWPLGGDSFGFGRHFHCQWQPMPKLSPPSGQLREPEYIDLTSSDLDPSFSASILIFQGINNCVPVIIYLIYFKFKFKKGFQN